MAFIGPLLEGAEAVGEGALALWEGFTSAAPAIAAGVGTGAILHELDPAVSALNNNIRTANMSSRNWNTPYIGT